MNNSSKHQPNIVCHGEQNQFLVDEICHGNFLNIVIHKRPRLVVRNENEKILGTVAATPFACPLSSY